MSTDNAEQRREQTVEEAVEQRRLWLLDQLAEAAARFRVALADDVANTAVNTFDMRSAGTVAKYEGHRVWLRVVVEDRDYQPACRWDGNIEANAIHDVPKPVVQRYTDRTEPGPYLAGRRLRGEIMTLCSGTTIAPGGVLHDDPKLPDTWWHDLDAALEALAHTPINWEHELGAVRYTTNSVHELFGIDLDPAQFTRLTLTTAHADLHWGNLRRPELAILDWESWRPAPAGYDLATLYCNSLHHPPTAHRIRTSPALASPTGDFALLSAMCRYLHTTGDGSDLDHLVPRLYAKGESIALKLSLLHNRG